jgi:predicted methyltransferase
MSKGDSVRRAVQTLRLRHGDCVEVLKGLDEASVGAIVSDPPYG